MRTTGLILLLMLALPHAGMAGPAVDLELLISRCIAGECLEAGEQAAARLRRQGLGSEEVDNQEGLIALALYRAAAEAPGEVARAQVVMTLRNLAERAAGGNADLFEELADAIEAGAPNLASLKGPSNASRD